MQALQATGMALLIAIGIVWGAVACILWIALMFAMILVPLWPFVAALYYLAR